MSCLVGNCNVGCDACSKSSLIGAGLSHAQARDIIIQAWQLEHGRAPTNNELNYTQSIAYFETGYGRKGQFARLAEQGMFNWGALQRPRNPDVTCPQGSSPGSDSGNPRCFYVFPTDVAAARRYIWELTKNPNHARRVAATLVAMRDGSADDVAAAMKIAPAWYEAPVGSYASAIRDGLKAIGGTIAQTAKTASSSIAPWLLLGALGTGIWWISKRRPVRR